MKGLNSVAVVQGNKQIVQCPRVYNLKATITSKPEERRGSEGYCNLEGKKGQPREELSPAQDIQSEVASQGESWQ